MAVSIQSVDCLFSSHMQEESRMDQIDQKILAHLKQNARARASDIGKAVHLSVSTVIERIHKMEDAGVICSYTVITNDAKVGNDVTALIEISL